MERWCTCDVASCQGQNQTSDVLTAALTHLSLSQHMLACSHLQSVQLVLTQTCWELQGSEQKNTDSDSDFCLAFKCYILSMWFYSFCLNSDLFKFFFNTSLGYDITSGRTNVTVLYKDDFTMCHNASGQTKNIQMWCRNNNKKVKIKDGACIIY